MNFSTPVAEFDVDLKIGAQDRILALGSCFAQVIGQRLVDFKTHTLLNPFGMLYNPKSIFMTLASCLDVAEGKATAEDVARLHLFESVDGKWYSWMAASLLCGASREECAAMMAAAVSETAQQLRALDILILTFGTNHYYLLKQEKVAVANCHKMPSDLFEEKALRVEEIGELFKSIHHRLKALRPNVKTILTVSPYRYLKYGLHENQLSKACLLLSTELCTKKFENTYYFPAYEILQDELRDYRFYAPDMLHPSDVAEQYIWQLFQKHHLDARLNLFIKEWTPVLKLQAHRSESQLHLDAIKAKTALLKERYPDFFD